MEGVDIIQSGARTWYFKRFRLYADLHDFLRAHVLTADNDLVTVGASVYWRPRPPHKTQMIHVNSVVIDGVQQK